MAKHVSEMTVQELKEADSTLSSIIILMMALTVAAIGFLGYRIATGGVNDAIPAIVVVVVFLGGSMPSFTRRATVRAELKGRGPATNGA